jgi:chromosome segregation ATPase
VFARKPHIFGEQARLPACPSAPAFLLQPHTTTTNAARLSDLKTPFLDISSTPAAPSARVSRFSAVKQHFPNTNLAAGVFKMVDSTTPAIYAIAVGLWVWLVWTIMHGRFRLKSHDSIADVDRELRRIQTWQSKNSGTIVDLVQKEESLFLRFEGLESKVTGIDSKMIDIGSRVTDTDSRVMDFDSRVTGIDSRMADINSKWTAVNTKVTGIDAKVTGIDSKMMDIDSRVTGIESRMTDMDSKWTGVASKVTGIASMVTDINSKMTDFNAKVTDIDSEWAGVDSKIKGINSSMMGFNSRMMDINSKWTGTTTTVTGIASKVTDINFKMTDFMTDIDSKWTGIDNKVTGINSNLDGLTFKVDGLDTTLTTFGSTMGGLASRIDEASTKLNEAQSKTGSQITVLQKDVNHIKHSQGSKIGYQVSQTKIQLDQLASLVRQLELKVNNGEAINGVINLNMNTLRADLDGAGKTVGSMSQKLGSLGLAVGTLGAKVSTIALAINQPALAYNGTFTQSGSVPNTPRISDGDGSNKSELDNLKTIVNNLEPKINDLEDNLKTIINDLEGNLKTIANDLESKINDLTSLMDTNVETLRQAWRQLTEKRVQALMDAGIRSDLMLYILAIEGINEDAVEKGLVSAEFFARIQESFDGAVTDAEIHDTLLHLGLVKKGVQVE